MNSTIRDVAEKAGVSVATVSRTFARPEVVSPRTRSKVMAAAEQLDFVVSRSAAALKSRHAMRIAMLTGSEEANWFDANVYKGLDNVFRPAGYDLVMYSIGSEAQRESFFAELPLRRNVDAVVVGSFSVTKEEIDDLKSLGIPIIGINVPHDDGFDAAVSISDADSMRLVVDHLHTLGHRRIAYVCTDASEAPLEYSADYRRQGFERACSRYSDVTPSIVAVSRSEKTVDPIISRIMMMPERPTAVCCLSDATAIPLLFKLPRAGLGIPQDISLMGFDDSYYAEEIGLTTIHQDPLALGRSAAQAALRLIEAGDAGTANTAPIHVSGETFLAIRNTTAPPRRD